MNTLGFQGRLKKQNSEWCDQPFIAHFNETDHEKAGWGSLFTSVSYLRLINKIDALLLAFEPKRDVL